MKQKGHKAQVGCPRNSSIAEQVSQLALHANLPLSSRKQLLHRHLS